MFYHGSIPGRFFKPWFCYSKFQLGNKNTARDIQIAGYVFW